jgi:hypothetical protein
MSSFKEIPSLTETRRRFPAAECQNAGRTVLNVVCGGCGAMALIYDFA